LTYYIDYANVLNMSPESSSEPDMPDDNPAIFSPDKAADWLRKSGIPDDMWPHIAEQGLSNHWNRTLVDVALGAETVDVNERFNELFGDEPHGPQRAENIRRDLSKNSHHSTDDE
jgi:hypothetical protein